MFEPNSVWLQSQLGHYPNVQYTEAGWNAKRNKTINSNHDYRGLVVRARLAMLGRGEETMAASCGGRRKHGLGVHRQGSMTSGHSGNTKKQRDILYPQGQQQEGTKQTHWESISGDYDWAAAYGQEEDQSNAWDPALLKHAGQGADEIGKTIGSHQTVTHKLCGIQRPPMKHKPVNQVRGKEKCQDPGNLSRSSS